MRILIVDDERSGVDLLEGFLRHWGHEDLVSTTDPTEAVDLCLATQPDLILLDMGMPQPDGYRLLRLLEPWRRSAGGLPVIALLESRDAWELQRAVALGASDVLRKPLDAVELKMRVANQLEARRVRAQLAEGPRELDGLIKSRVAGEARARIEVLERLARTAEYREDPSGRHVERVGRMAALIAHELGWLEEEVDAIRLAATLHDVGKVALPDELLLSPAKLGDQEREAIREHTLKGAELLAGAGSNVLRLAEQIALTHHERWDGKGYPVGLRGDEIPMSGRIVAVADVYDALTHARPGREPWSPKRALAMIRQASGRQFDPAVVAAFEALDQRGLIDPLARGLRHSGRYPMRRSRYAEE